MTKDPSRYEESEQQTLVENYERDRKEIIDAAAEYPELTRRSTTLLYQLLPSPYVEALLHFTYEQRSTGPLAERAECAQYSGD